MTWLTPVGYVVIDNYDLPMTDGQRREASMNAGRRILALMMQNDKPIHLAGGRPETDGTPWVEWDLETKLIENKRILKVGVEVDLARCDDAEYQQERVAAARAAVEEALAP